MAKRGYRPIPSMPITIKKITIRIPEIEYQRPIVLNPCKFEARNSDFEFYLTQSPLFYLFSLDGAILSIIRKAISFSALA
jgi:hypothetical protein